MVWEQVFLNLVRRIIYFAFVLLVGFLLVGWLSPVSAGETRENRWGRG